MSTVYIYKRKHNRECYSKHDNVSESNFYPSSAIPYSLKWLIALNPLVKTIDMADYNENSLPEITGLLGHVLIGIVWCELNYRFLRSSRKYFGEVI